METIQIIIPKGLTTEQEINHIAKVLGKQYLKKGKDKLSIGVGYVINELQTRIEITREPVEKMAFFFTCPCCNKKTDVVHAKNVFTNYGGSIRKRRTCSNECRETYISINPARITKTRKELNPININR